MRAFATKSRKKREPVMQAPPSNSVPSWINQNSVQVRGFPLAPWAPFDPLAQPEYVNTHDEYDEFEAEEDDYLPDDYEEEYLEGGNQDSFSEE